MNSQFFVDLIKAHFASDADFRKASLALADELDRQGDSAVARDLRSALEAHDFTDVYEASSVMALPALDKGEPLAPTSRDPNPFSGKRAKKVSEMPSTTPVASFASAPTPMPNPRQSPASVPKDRDSGLELYEVLTPSVSLDSLVLPKEQRRILDQIVEEWKRAPELQKVGLTPTHRVLFSGPPGCGKTTAAHGLATAMGLPIAYVRLDSLVSSYLGQTSANIRRIFESIGGDPIVLFLDEIDAIAKKRDDSQEVGELKRVVISLLQNFDNVSSNVFIFAATNHAHLLDSAVWRRFDVAIHLDLPSQAERVEIFGSALHADVSPPDMARLGLLLAGLSGSQILDIAQRLLRGSILSKQQLHYKAISDAIIGFQTKHSRADEDTTMQLVDRLISNDVKWRELEKIFETPFSTLRDRHTKWKKNQRKESGED